MRHFQLDWDHDNPDYPAKIFFEIDADRYETRKVCVYPNGDIELATLDFETERTFLSEAQIPALAEMNSDELLVEEVSSSTFELIWNESIALKQ